MSPLETPEDFPALPNRTESERQFLAWRYPSFEAHSSWAIFKSARSGEYFVRRLEYDPRDQPRGTILPTDIYGAESPLLARDAQRILESFETLRIPPFRQSPVSVVLDGVHCGIQFGNRLQGTRVHWLIAPNAEWMPLMQLFEQTIESLDHALPASTLRVYPGRRRYS